MAKLLIVIVSFNSKRYTQECIESIRRCIPDGTYSIAVVDNASTDGSAEWLMQQKDIILTRNNHNWGFGPACNQAVKSSVGTKFEDANVFLLNNDTVINHNSLPNLIRALEMSDDIGAVSAMANYAGNRQQIDVEFSSTEEYVIFGDNLEVPEEDRYIEKVRLNGFAMLIRRQIWDEIGGFDEDFAPGYYEDDALSIEIQKLGYRLILVKDSFIYHVGSASFVKTGTNSLSYEHHKLFIDKYGFDILDYVYPCGAVISQIPFGRRDHFRVLHLGCGLGAEMKTIRSLCPNSKVFGIEPDPVLRNITGHTEEVYESMVTAYEKIAPGSIDLLIADENYYSKLSNEEKDNLAGLLSERSYVIHRLHDYDDYDFDSLKMVVFDSKVYTDAVASMLSKRGLIVATDVSEELKTFCGISKDQVLEVAPDSAIIPYLTAHFGRLKETDPECNKQRIFNLIRQRFEKMAKCPSQEEFMKSNPVTITVNKNCLEASNDICNALSDATVLSDSIDKLTKGHLERLSSDSWNDCAYITAEDSHGSYGIIGFYSRNTRENKVLFSAYTFAAVALGISEYIVVQNTTLPGWVQIDTGRSISEDPILKNRLRVLLKGQSILSPVADYLIGGNVTCELGDNSDNTLPTKLFTDRFHVIVYSLLRSSTQCIAPDASSSPSDEDLLGETFESLENIRDNAPGGPVLIILTEEEIFPIINEFAMDHDKTKTINITALIKNRSDIDGSKYEFTTGFYSDLTEEIVKIINDSF